MTDQTPWCCTGYVSECPLCPEYGTRLTDPCRGHPVDEPNQETVRIADLHARRAHPDFEYATTRGPRKQWDDPDRPPAGESCDPDYTWEPNLDAGRPGMGWDRFEYHEEAYWRRPKKPGGAQETDKADAAPAEPRHPTRHAARSTEDQVTDQTYPYQDGEVTVLGPEIFASSDGAVISWKGENYVRQAEPKAASPAATLVPRDPCPRCEDCPLIPRAEMAQHQRDHHPETVDAAPDRLAQSGVRTPGCTCGHDGMGVSWHGDDCPWRHAILDGPAQPRHCPCVGKHFPTATNCRWCKCHRQPGGAEAEAERLASDLLDQLYRERDEARQHAAAIAAQRDRLRQRMNNLADRWDNALAPDKAYAQTLRAEISVAPFDPDGAMTVQEYTERGQHLWAFRCWGTETCDGWLGLGHHTQTSALLERERHVAEEHADPTAPDDYDRWRAALGQTQEPDAAWTPPPPGSTAEQLPDDLLDLIRGGLPDYTSTACVTADALAVAVHWSHPRLEELRAHAERLHNRCRRNQKFTGQLCVCGCH